MANQVLLYRVQHRLVNTLRARRSYEEIAAPAPQRRIEYHTDHGTNFTMTQAIEMVMRYLHQINNNRLPYKNIVPPNNEYPPFKKALSPANLLRVCPLYENLKTLTQNDIYQSGQNTITFDAITAYDGTSLTLRLSGFNGPMRQIKITFDDNISLNKGNQYQVNPIDIAMNPDDFAGKYCKYTITQLNWIN